MLSISRCVVRAFVLAAAWSAAPGCDQTATPPAESSGAERREPPTSQPAEQPGRQVELLSLHLLMDRARPLDASQVAQAASRAWKRDIGTSPASSAGNVVGTSPGFIVTVADYSFLVHNVDRPLATDPTTSPAIRDDRSRELFARHRAWLGVELLERPAGATRDAAGQMLGRLLAELVADDCIAIYRPDTHQIAPCEPPRVERLRGDHPLDAVSPN